MKRFMLRIFMPSLMAVMLVNCTNTGTKDSREKDSGGDKEFMLMTLDPGHFHASLVQKEMVPGVSRKAYVFAPEGDDYQRHLNRIENFNNREENPTDWEETVYTGPDYLDKMLTEKPGNVVVIAGNNAKKTTYIKQCVSNGLNVLADKPMVIFPEKFPELEEAFRLADENDVLLYDIMTERYSITSIIQKELSRIPEVFGELKTGTPEEPACVKHSVHHWFKYVAGEPIKRPPWFFDESQQGEALVGVSTHLIDLIQWAVYPQEVLKKADIQLLDAKRWTTPLNLKKFKRITRLSEWPSYLEEELENGTLNVYANGELNYKLRDVHSKVIVEWHYEAPEGGGDTHYSIMRGTKSNLIIQQGEKENYVPELYVEMMAGMDAGEFENALRKAVKNQIGYDGLAIEKLKENYWKIEIPGKHREGHEAHFKRVLEKYLEYLKEGKLPEWEKSYMIVKYYLTTEALEMARDI